MTKNELLATARVRYLQSGDYNGLHLYGQIGLDLRQAAVELVRAGLVQVVSEEDYPNPHIRPWKSLRTLKDQVRSIESLTLDAYGFCIYPTAEGMKGVRLPRRFADRPYDRAMAKGRGTLELAYFSFDVLEPYRNDPRYHFQYFDFGVSMGIGDEAYLDEAEPERDKTGMNHIGFAYDLDGYDSSDAGSPVTRRVAAFYGDLAKLTPEHQQRWKTYQVSDDALRPHPAWWMSQMGNWPDGLGPFERLFLEITNINELFAAVWDEPLFTTADRPHDFGWILRPSQREWDDFISQLDKILSENLRHDALDAAGIERKDSRNQNLGTLSRLARFIERNGVQGEDVRLVLKPLRDVRAARQRPAHSLRANINDHTFIHRQIALIEEVNRAMKDIRYWLASHPKNADWKAKYEELKDYRM